MPESFQRNVELRALGSREATAVLRARSVWRQTLLLCGVWQRLLFRVGDKTNSPSVRHAAHRESAERASLLGMGSAGFFRRNILPRHPSIARRSFLEVGSFATADPKRRALLGTSCRPTTGTQRCGCR